MTIIKLGTIRDNEDIAHVYPDIWEREQTTGPDRLVIAPSANHTHYLSQLAELWSSDFWILYVLLVSRGDNETGRYESPVALSFDELRSFLDEFAVYFNTDGRHHVWIGSTTNEGLLVYDHHNVIYAYGELDVYEEFLRRNGFHQSAVSFPVPHSHYYNEENDEDENRIFDRFNWRYSPLQEDDEW